MRIRVSPTPSNTPSNTPTITPSVSSCPTYGWKTNIKLFECNYGQEQVGLPLTGWTVEHSGITYTGLTEYTSPQAATWCNIPVQEPFVGASYIFNLTTIASGWQLCNQNSFDVAWDSFEVVLTEYFGRSCYTLTECVLEYNATINYYLGGILQTSTIESIQFTEYPISENPSCPVAYTMFNQVMMFIVDVIRPTPTITPTMTSTPSPTPLCQDILNFSLYSGPAINALQGNYIRQFSNSATTFTYGYFSGGTPQKFFTGATFDTGQNYPVYMMQSGNTYSVLGRNYITSSTWRWQIFTTTGSSYLDNQVIPIGSLQITPNKIAYNGMYIIPEGLNTYIGRTYNIDYPASCITPTPTATQTNTPTNTSTIGITPTPTKTSTPTRTPSITQTQTNTATQTSTPTPSITQTRTPQITPTNTSTNTPTGTIVSTPTNTATPSPTPVCLHLDIQTNASLDITITTISVNALLPSVIGGTLPNTPGNGTNLCYDLSSGTYEVRVYTNCSISGQRVSINSPTTGYECQNVPTGSNVITFASVGFDGITYPQVIAEDGTC